MEKNKANIKIGNKFFELNKKNLKWDKESKEIEYKQHETIDNSEPTYPNNTYRPIISHKMRLSGERIYTPFFTLEFIIRYKDLFVFCLNNDQQFKEYIDQNLGTNIDPDNLNKDELSLPVFNFYKESPENLFKLIKKLRKKTKSSILDLGVKNVIKKQLPKNNVKANQDLENRAHRIQMFYADKTVEAIHETAKLEKEKLEQKIKSEKEELIQKYKQKGPSIGKMASNFAMAMRDFAQSGFLRVTPQQYKSRMDICNKCEFWQADARLGMGKCLKCGCTGAKQWIASSECPIQKWGKISKEEILASKEEENATAQETQNTVSQQADGSSQGPSPEAQG